MTALSVSEYGVIGNRSSAVLVSRLGSIDWCCLPYLDSDSHFGALLDEFQGGSFKIAPTSDFHSEQKYVARTHVLQTLFKTRTGTALLTDWMPVGSGVTEEPVIYRRFEVTEGKVEWSMRCHPRFKYGAEAAMTEKAGDAIRFRGMQFADVALLVVDGHKSGQAGTLPQGKKDRAPSLRIANDGRMAVAQGTLTAGESVSFAWIWGRNGRMPEIPSPEKTIQDWQQLSHQCPMDTPCPFAGPWHDTVARAGLLTRILIPQYSGSLAESVTTSLPSLRGGSRNWDHRYAWLRSTSSAIHALHELQLETHAKDCFAWLAEMVIRDRALELQPVYTLDGGRYLAEQELASLTGYAGSRPVRVGNLSARQFQLDTYGHALLAASYAEQLWGPLSPELWSALTEITDHTSQAWRRPDRGYWEVRAKPLHFMSSKVYSWACLDRACYLAQRRHQPIPERWRRERETLHRTICEQGFDPQRGSFIRAFGEKDLDASALQIPLLGFLPFEDERVQQTLVAIQAELGDGVLIRRGIPADGSLDSDGAHLISSFWYVSCLALSGRVDEASDRLAELCTYATPLSLFAEQVDPSTAIPSGNFPSASAHLALVQAAYWVGYATAKAKGKPFRPSPWLPRPQPGLTPGEKKAA